MVILLGTLYSQGALNEMACLYSWLSQISANKLEIILVKKK